jgi:uncharacterized iron-regulated membrane protein
VSRLLARGRSPVTRQFWVRVHRYAGLTLALFLMIAGLTGSVIAFNHELDEWLNPALFRVQDDRAPLAPLELAALVERRDPRLRVSYLPLHHEPGSSLDIFVEPRIDPATNAPYAVPYNQVFLHPATGEILGTRLWGACCFERENLISFLYTLHYSLHLPEKIGLWVMGLVAIVWALDSLVGLYLTFPGGRPFLRHWRTAWRVKRGAGPYRLNFDLHRAGGLWAWALLLVLAVSAVALSLEQQVMRPLVSLLSPVTPDVYHEREHELGGRIVELRVPREQVVAAATAEARRRGLDEPLDGLYYASTAGLYIVGVGDHHAPGLGSSYFYLDATDGRLVGAHVPGEGTAGDRFLQLQFPLHSGQIGGWPTRVLVAVLGLVVAMLSLTGVIVWWRKARARASRAPRRHPVDHRIVTHSTRQGP